MKNILIVCLMAAYLLGCSSSNEPEVQKSIKLSYQYTESVMSKAATTIESIEITKATFLIRNIKYKTQSEGETESMFKTTPLILELDMDEEVHTIDDVEVLSGTYNRIEFDIHKAVAEDTLEMEDQLKEKFMQFLEDGKYSIILEGKITEDGNEEDFIYKSKVNVKQKNDLDEPLVISEDSPSGEVLLMFSSATWFSSNSGEILDPRASTNNNQIDKNIRNSIHTQKRNK